MNRFFTLLLIILISQLLIANPNHQVFENAVKYENSQAEELASLEYKRFLFLENYKPSSQTIRSCIFLSRYYEKETDFDRALFFIERAVNFSEMLQNGSDEHENCKIEHIKILSRTSNFQKAKTKLMAYSMDGNSKKTRSCAWKNLILGELKHRNYDEAFQEYQHCLKTALFTFTEDEIKIINETFSKLHGSKPKNPKIALYLSVIPGLGQFYAHDFKDGLNALLLNGTIIAATTLSILTQNYGDIVYFEFGPLFRFYRGNLYNAQKDTYNYNDRLFDEILSPIFKILEN